MTYKGVCVMSAKSLRTLALFGLMVTAMFSCDTDKPVGHINPANGNGTETNITAIKEISVGSINSEVGIVIGTTGADSTKKLFILNNFIVTTQTGQKFEITSSKNKTVDVEQTGLDKLTATSSDFKNHYSPKGETFTFIVKSQDLNKDGVISKNESFKFGSEDIKELRVTTGTVSLDSQPILQGVVTTVYDAFKNSEKVFNNNKSFKSLSGNNVERTGYTGPIAL